MITIGLDPHPDSHTVAALDENGSVLASLRVSNDAQGVVQLHQFALPFVTRCWAVEGAANRYIRTFVYELLEHGEVIHHIPPDLTSQYRTRIGQKKNEVVDAANAARALLANPELPAFQPGKGQHEFQNLTRTQRRLSEQLKANKMALQALATGSSARSALTQVIQVLGAPGRVVHTDEGASEGFRTHFAGGFRRRSCGGERHLGRGRYDRTFCK